MKLYGKKVSNFWELEEYQKGSKKIIITLKCECTKGDGILLFDRNWNLGCVLEVVGVRKSVSRYRGMYFIETAILNPEKQDLPLSYFGYTGLVGLQFLGYSALCKKLKLKPQK